MLNVSEIDYASHFMDKTNYAERCKAEADAGKGVFVAASCPKCWYQIPNEGMALAANGTYCKCGDGVQVPQSELIATLSPTEWGIRVVKPARCDANRW